MTEADHVVGHLVLVTQVGEGEKVSLRTSPFFIGRNANCQIRLKDVNVCERHCMLQISQRKTVVLHRLDSDFPVLVNGEEITSDGHPLRNNDVIQVSDFRFRWCKNENEEKLSKNAAHLSFCFENQSELKVAPNRKSAPECLYSWSKDGNNAEGETCRSNDIAKNAGKADSCEDGNSDEEIFNRTSDYDSDSSPVSTPADQNNPEQAATVAAEANSVSDASKADKNGGLSNIGETMDGNSNSTEAFSENVSDIDLIISEDEVLTSGQNSQDVANSCLKTPERSEENVTPPSSELRNGSCAPRESTASNRNEALENTCDTIELNILENTHVTPPKECQLNDESRVQSTPQSSATPLKHLTGTTPHVAESPGKFRGRRSTGIVPCVGTPSDVYRIKRSILVTPAIRSSRDTVRREPEMSSASRQPRRRSSERKSTPLKSRFSDRCIQRESILHSPIIEDLASERCEESQNESLSRDSGKFKFVQSRRRRFGGSNFAVENRILEESETSQNTTVGTVGNANEDEDIGDEDKSLMALSLCDDSSVPMSARIIIHGDRAESVSDSEELNSTFTIEPESAEAPKENSPIKEPQPLKSILTPLPKLAFSHKEKSAKKVTFACNVIAESSNRDSVDDCSFQLADSYNSSAQQSSYNSAGTPEVSSNLYSKIEDGLDSFCQHEEVFTSRRSLSSAFSQNSTSTPVKQQSLNNTSLNSPKLKNVTRSLSNWDQSFETSETRRVSRDHRSSAFSAVDTFTEDNVDLTALQEAEKEQSGGFSLIRSTNSTKELSDEFVSTSDSKLADSLSDTRESQKSHSRVSTSANTISDSDPDLSSKTLDGVAGLLTTIPEHDQTADITANTSLLPEVICNTGVTPQHNQMKLNSTPCALPNQTFDGDSTPNNSAINDSVASSRAEKSVPTFVGTPYPNLDRTANRTGSFLSNASSRSDEAVKFATPKRPSRVTKKSSEGAKEEFVTPKQPSRATARSSEVATTPSRKSARISLKANTRKDTPAISRSNRKTSSIAESASAAIRSSLIQTPKETESTPRPKLSILEETANDSTAVETPSSASTIALDGGNTAGIKIVVTESTILECDEPDSNPEPIEEAATQDFFGTVVDQEAETQDVFEMENAETQLMVPELPALEAVDEVEEAESEPIEEALTQVTVTKIPDSAEPTEWRDKSAPPSPSIEEAETQEIVEILARAEERSISARDKADERFILPFSPEIVEPETQDILPPSPAIEEPETQDILPPSPEIEETETQDIIPLSPEIEQLETQDIIPPSPQMEDIIPPPSSEIEEAQTQDIILFSQGMEEAQTQDIAVLAQVLEEAKTQDAFALLHDRSEVNASDDNAPLPQDSDEADLSPLNIEDMVEATVLRRSTTPALDETREVTTVEEAEAQVVQNETPDILKGAALPDTSPNRLEAEAEAPVSVDEKIEEAETQDLLCERIEEAETQAVFEEHVSLASLAEAEVKELVREVSCADVNLSSTEIATAEPPVAAEAVSSEVEPSISAEADAVSPAAGHIAGTSEIETTVEQKEEPAENANVANSEVVEQSESPQVDREGRKRTPRSSRVGVLHPQSGLVRRSARISLAKGSPLAPSLINLEKSASKRTKKDRDNQENEVCFDGNNDMTPAQKRRRTMDKRIEASTPLIKSSLLAAKLKHVMVDAGTQTSRRNSMILNSTPSPRSNRRALVKLDNTERLLSPYKISIPIRQSNSPESQTPFSVDLPVVINTAESLPAEFTPLSPHATHAYLSTKPKRVSKKRDAKPAEQSVVTQISQKAPSPKPAAKRTRQQKASTVPDASAGSPTAVKTSQRAKTTTKRTAKKVENVVLSSPESTTSSHAGSPKGVTRKRRNPYAEPASAVTPPKRAARGRAAAATVVPTEVNNAPSPPSAKPKRGVRGSRETLNECVSEPKGKTNTQTKTEIKPEAVAPADKKRAIRSKKNVSLVEEGTCAVEVRTTRGTRRQAGREVVEKASPANKKGAARARQANVVDQTESESEPAPRVTRKKAAVEPPAQPQKPSTSKRGATKNRREPEQEVSPKSPVVEVEEKRPTRKRAKKVPELENTEAEPEPKPTRIRTRGKNVPSENLIVDAEEDEVAKRPKRGRTAKRVSLVKDEKAESSRGPRLTVTRKSLTLKTAKRKTRAESEPIADDEPRQKRTKVLDSSDEETTKSATKRGRPVKVIVGKKVTTTTTSTAKRAKKAAAKDDELALESPPVTKRTSMMTRGATRRKR